MTIKIWLKENYREISFKRNLVKLFFILFTNWMRYANLIFAISLRESRIEKHWGVLTVFLLLKSFGFLHHILVNKRGCCSSFSLFGESEMQQIKLNSLRISYFHYKQVRWSTCYIFLLQHRPRVPFLEITCNLTGPKPYFTIKIKRIEKQVLIPWCCTRPESCRPKPESCRPKPDSCRMKPELRSDRTM